MNNVNIYLVLKDGTEIKYNSKEQLLYDIEYRFWSDFQEVLWKNPANNRCYGSKDKESFEEQMLDYGKISI